MGDAPGVNDVENDIQIPRPRGVFISEKHLELLLVISIGIFLSITITGEWFTFYHYKSSSTFRWFAIISSTASQVLALPYASWKFIKIGYSSITRETLRNQLHQQNEVQNAHIDLQIGGQNAHTELQIAGQNAHLELQINGQNAHNREEMNKMRGDIHNDQAGMRGNMKELLSRVGTQQVLLRERVLGYDNEINQNIENAEETS